MSNSDEGSGSSESESESSGDDRGESSSGGSGRHGTSSSGSSKNAIAMVAQSDFEKMRLKLIKEKQVLVRKVKKLEAEADSTSTPRYGRNNVTRHEWGRRDHCNCKNISDFCKNNLFPRFKFLPHKWKKWTPKEEGTLCMRMMNLVQVPRECSGEVYWIERIVPIVNKKYVEMRSNLNSAIRKIYQSMISCITGFCGC